MFPPIRHTPLLLAALSCCTPFAAAQSGPRTTPADIQAAVDGTPAIPPGPFQPTWDSLRANYKVPVWFRDAKFGIMIHWGLYSVAAYHNEWYAKYIYSNAGIRDWHIQTYGPLDTHGYLSLAPAFGTKFDAKDWAELFKKAGAKYVIPCAEHHDGFSLWDSAASPFNSAKLGPKRDLIGELAKTTRAADLKFGVSNHSIENYTFQDGRSAGLKSDLDDPKLAEFYWTTHTPETLHRFLNLWIVKNFELIDKYQPDMLWFDNGLNGRNFDPLKLKVAAYYYNRALEWKKEVSISTKSEAYLAGSILDYERQGRAPKQLTDFVWQPDDPIGPTFGYTTVERGKADRSVDMTVGKPAGFIRLLIQNVSRNGNYLLNISPRGDGTIPDNQREVLLAIGAWLEVNGDAIYGTRPWKQSEEGKVHFTTKGDALYAITIEWPANGEIALASLGTAVGKVAKVELLGAKGGPLEFAQTDTELKVKFPAQKTGDTAWALKITGLKLPTEAPTATR